MSVSPYISASFFNINSEIERITELGEGNIHNTFFVKTSGIDSFDFLLQHKNKNVFKDVPSMMHNTARLCYHLRNKIEKKGLDPHQHTLNLIPTLTGEFYYVDSEGEFWTMCIFIKDSITYHKPLNSAMARAGGIAIGEFQYLLSDFTEPLTDILPGFHNMRYRFEQWDKVISNISTVHQIRYSQEIDWVESRREEMMKFHILFEKGYIPKRVAHNDAKLLNILFDKHGSILCLIDLDTVMYGSVLYDFGDAVRSFTNNGEEDDIDPENVFMNLDYFEAFTSGYIQEASAFLIQTEIDCLAFAPLYITFEQLLRFLMDYLDGNRYYRISHPEHNMQRAKAQFALLLDMEKHYGEMKSCVIDIYNQFNKS